LPKACDRGTPISINAFPLPALVAALSASGLWDAAFQTGTVFALLAAVAWLLVNCERIVRRSRP
jgi:hypothetical protein